MTQSITVAICTFNRAALLESTLQSFTELAVPTDLSWELLVVDNRCTDTTQAVCASFQHRLPLRVVVENEPGLSNARNRALVEATGDCIVFTDDDVLLDRQWLAAFAGAATRWPRAAAFGGPIEPYFPVQPDPDLLAAFPVMANGFCGLDHRCEEGPLSPAQHVLGANMAYRMSAIAGLTFDPRLGHTQDTPRGGEEVQFLGRVRERGDVIWCPAMRLKHYVDPSRMTLPYLTLYHRCAGEAAVRLRGVRPSPLMFGAPRWLWRAYVGSYLSHALYRLAGRRRSALERLRDHCYYGGILTETRRLWRAGQLPA